MGRKTFTKTNMRTIINTEAFNFIGKRVAGELGHQINLGTVTDVCVDEESDTVFYSVHFDGFEDDPESWDFHELTDGLRLADAG